MKQINMLESPVRQVFFSYLVPSISATLVTSIYILADTMMIGRGVGGSGIAAMNILLPLYNTYFGIGMMCGVGGSVLFGFSRGRGDEKRARSYFTAALCVVLALSAVFLILGRIFFNPLITFMGNTPLLNEYTVPYGTVLTTAAPMFALSSFLQAFVRNDGAPKLAMAGVISGGVTNVILDYVYIFIMKWGMRGAALATATGTTLTVLILASHFFSKDNHLKLEFSDVWRRVPEVLGNGLASFILEISNGFVMLLFNRQLLAYVGEMGITVYGIITNTALVASSISNGIAQAVQPLLSANFGAGNLKRVGEARKLGVRTGFAAGFIFTAIGHADPGTVVLSVPGPDTGDPHNGGPGDPAVFPLLLSQRVEHHQRNVFPVYCETAVFFNDHTAPRSDLKQRVRVPSPGTLWCRRNLAYGDCIRVHHGGRCICAYEKGKTLIY